MRHQERAWILRRARIDELERQLARERADHVAPDRALLRVHGEGVKDKHVCELESVQSPLKSADRAKLRCVFCGSVAWLVRTRDGRLALIASAPKMVA